MQIVISWKHEPESVTRNSRFPAVQDGSEVKRVANQHMSESRVRLLRPISRALPLAHQALCLNLVTNAVIVGNTVYMAAVVE
jgi:hypothetical protein